MTNAELIQKIRAEIERLKRQLIRGACASQIAMETNCKEEAYDEVLSFLSTLEKSLLAKAADGEGFEKEFSKFSNDPNAEDYAFPIDLADYKDFARHFYDLGCRRTAEKYDEIEYNRQRAEASGSSEIPNDLKEAANMYSNCYSNPDGALAKAARRAYITGVKWDREQMMKEAVEVVVWDAGVDFAPHPVISVEDFNIKDGDKVRIIIVKE